MRSDELPLSRAVVDRAAHLRTVDEEARVLADPTTRVVLLRDGRVPVDARGALVLTTVERASKESPGDGGEDPWLLLGADDDGAYVARRSPGGPDDLADLPRRGSAADRDVHAPASSSAPPVAPTRDVADEDAVRWASLREVGAHLDARDAGLVATAVALDAWHERHPRCPRCGAATRVTQAGWVRTCTVDGSEHYPRTDPAVIMAVVDEADRLLLAHAAAWPAGRWSTLAGFVEPGESLEHAVRREVAEETHVVVGDVTYAGSQPWPFPASLMVAFVARALTTDVEVDAVEVEHAAWFTRDELARAVVAGDVVPPTRSSIARALVEDWFGGPLPQPAAR
ncbi:NAD(+) diphosphatase [Cellulomonas palmilytica]|uniref:NAD(+) diphosphatase n=1 Tax=Cellulomonas palmilytica TaxID=2608402 RepID=UPI001F173C59|nr:NAD(+) diphosphatase [Cellulomonas palmilytica]UJP39658.1 NAD(+) diphosphatase [Cellulomonas palmilytica]